MAEFNNTYEEPFQNNTQEPNKNNIPEASQNNFQDQANIPEPYQNNVPEPYQNNIPETYQNNIPAPYQNNIPSLYQNNITLPYQNNIPGPIQNNFYENNINQGIVNEELDKKLNNLKCTHLFIMFIIFIIEIVLEFITIPIVDEEEEKNHDSRGSNFGEGLYTVVLIVCIFPILTILSSIILCLSCQPKNPNAKITISIVLCIIRALIMISIIVEDELVIIGIVLEILNFTFMINSVCYQVKLRNILP